MNSSSRLNGYLIDCASIPLDGFYFQVTWRATEPGESVLYGTHSESYICRASSEDEALANVYARAQFMVRFMLQRNIVDDTDHPVGRGDVSEGG